jgi:2-polyprenyl-6-methoxyphenol hydroxylase-like FAD-dependent oxidoreductase
MRVAIVGAGASGLAVALHLSPLVSRGLLHPVDVYEASPANAVHPHCSTATSNNANEKSSQASATKVDENFHPGSGCTGRPIGVGIWSTALRPFAFSGWPSHTHLLRRLEQSGKYVGQVGYKTPAGSWLARSELDEGGVDIAQDNTDPSLLFLKESDLLAALREAARTEEDLGHIQIRYGSDSDSSDKNSGNADGNGNVNGRSTEVESIVAHSDGLSGSLVFKDGSRTDRRSPYHFIVSAEGMSSRLRSAYAGRNVPSITKISTGMSSLGGMKSNGGGVSSELREEWEEDVQAEINTIEDRGYTVFRGNSPLTDEEAGMDGVSFQTWGVGRSMRFAAVGMSTPSPSGVGGDEESQVWFATTNDRSIASIKDPGERREKLVDHFRTWHDPVARLIETTPSEDILVERGVAHRHSTRPVLDLAAVIEQERRVEERAKAKERCQEYHEPPKPADHDGPGPVLIFVGDSSMTVDPVLAQGFTIGMEAAADLAQTLQKCTGPNFAVDINDSNEEDNESPLTLLFDPDRLRFEVKERHHRRYSRMMALLRATELVQALAQPSGPFGSFLTRFFIRPAMLLTPNFAKRPMFDFMLRYSLGLTAGGDNNNILEKARKNKKSCSQA